MHIIKLFGLFCILCLDTIGNMVKTVFQFPVAICRKLQPAGQNHLSALPVFSLLRKNKFYFETSRFPLFARRPERIAEKAQLLFAFSIQDRHAQIQVEGEKQPQQVWQQQLPGEFADMPEQQQRDQYQAQQQ